MRQPIGVSYLLYLYGVPHCQCLVSENPENHQLHALDPGEIETMKRQPGKDMIVFGSGSIVSQLTQHGLIDEYQFVVCPSLLGSGRSLLRGVSQHSRLDLLEAKAYPSGDVLLRYVRPNETWP